MGDTSSMGRAFASSSQLFWALVVLMATTFIFGGPPAVRIACAATPMAPTNGANSTKIEFLFGYRHVSSEAYNVTAMAPFNASSSAVNASYTSDYAYVCDAVAPGGTWYRHTPEVCGIIPFASSGVGGGWLPATIPSRGALDAVRTAFGRTAVARGHPRASAHIGARIFNYYADTSPSRTFQWTAGRLSGRPFSSPSAVPGTPLCHPIAYRGGLLFDDCQMWGQGQPDGDANGWTAMLWVLANPPMGLNDARDQPWTCALCERSPCAIAADCYGPNTVAVVSPQGTGYFPDCGCRCVAGAFGDRCEFPMPAVDHGPYASEYTRVCPAGGQLLWASAAAACAALGDGWTLATLPSSAAFAAVGAHLSVFGEGAPKGGGPMWTAASETASGSNNWRWAAGAGRLGGSSFSTGASAIAVAVATFDRVPASVTLTQLSLWAAARPTTPAASAAVRCGRISAAGPYEPAPHPKLDHAACDATDAPCALCERSQCRIGTDCYGPNTAAVSSFFPCTCTCKPGTWGAKCEWPFVVPLGASSNAGPDAEGIYYSEYIGVCQASPMTQPAALSACATRRDADGAGGWSLASFATGESLRRVQAQLATLLAANAGADTWVGAVDPTSIGSWRWAAGRLKDFGEFHVNSLGCRSISYLLKEPIFDRCSLWGTGRPNNSTSPVYAFLANALGRRMQDVPATATARCYACERSRCQLGLDCLEHNLAEMRGDYYPSCSCVCKTGAWGDRCEWPLIVDQGNYVSEYRHIAAPAGITQAKADGTCADMLGAGWHAATFPTATSFAMLRDACGSLPLQNAWIGASKTNVPEQWVWSSGRLKGLNFFNGKVISGNRTGTTCETISYSGSEYLPPASTFQNCPWSPSQPDNSAGSQNCALMWSSGYLRLDDTGCGATIYFAACERSFCSVAQDCSPTNTLTANGTWPNCTCTCKEGASGSRCQYPVVHDVGPYIGEYKPVQTRSKLNFNSACEARGPPGESGLAFVNGPAWERVAQAIEVKTISYWMGLKKLNVTAHTWYAIAGRLNSSLVYTGLATAPDKVCSDISYPSFAYSSLITDNCRWDTSQPDGTNGRDACAYMWGTIPGKNFRWDDTTCDVSFDGYLCERSPCRMGTDCYEPNTAYLNTSVYYPNCKCTCKSGAWGDKCEWPLRYDYGNYSSEYGTVCAAVPMPWASAAGFCSAQLGPEWFPASFAGSGPHAAFTRQQRSPDATLAWTGAAAVGALWKWAYGRHANMTMYAANKCQTYELKTFAGTSIFNNCGMFGAGQPATAGGACVALRNTNGFALGTAQCDSTTQARCVACERSLCSISADCYEPNTASVNKYYPCECKCKPGASGDKCRFPLIVEQGPYASEYDMSCLPEYNSLTWAEAERRCRARGPEWDLATMPTPQASEALEEGRRGLPNVAPWLGGRKVAAPHRWEWTGGRLAGVHFYSGVRSTNGTCQNYSYPSLNAPLGSAFGECQWQFNQPDNLGGRQDCLSFLAPPRTGVDDTECDKAAWRCYVCERSPCRMGTDCYGPNTAYMNASAYYPNCKCTCKPGAWGDKCQFPLVVSHGAYTSEYVPACGSGPLTMASAEAVCASRLNGAHLATFPTEESLRTVRNAVGGDGFSASFVGVRGFAPAVGSGPSLWRWAAGRLNGIQIFAGHINITTNPTTTLFGDGCLSFAYPTFSAGLPTVFKHCPWRYGGPVGPSSAANDAALLWAAPNTFNGEPFFGAAAWADTANAPSCALCERSFCAFATDCYEPNTAYLNTSAYFPNCKCSCKPGAWGAKCEWPMVDSHGGVYPSSYLYHCEEGAAWAHSDGAGVCARRGDGWSLATFPDAASFYNFRRQVLHNAGEGPFGQAWVGASNGIELLSGQGSVSAWRWRAGRFAGSVFSYDAGNEVKCIAPETMLFGVSFAPSPPSCAWGVARPSETSSGTPGSCASIDSQAKWRLGDRPCGAPLSCVACERTPCVSIAVDCVEANTRTHAGPSAYFPRCCTCRHGKTGYACHLDATETEALSFTASTEQSISMSGSDTVSSTVEATRSVSLPATETISVTDSGALPSLSRTNAKTGGTPTQGGTASASPAATNSATLEVTASTSLRGSVSPTIVEPTLTFSNDVPQTISISTSSSLSHPTPSPPPVPSASQSLALSLTTTANTSASPSREVSPSEDPEPTPSLSRTAQATPSDSPKAITSQSASSSAMPSLSAAAERSPTAVSPSTSAPAPLSLATAMATTTLTPAVVPSGDPNATAVDPIPHNAAEDPDGPHYGEILRGAAGLPSLVGSPRGFERSCARRFEHILARQFAVATPLPVLNGWETFAGALAVNAGTAAAALLLGLATVAVAAVVQRCRGRGQQSAGGEGFWEACVAVRFPATALLCYIFLLAPSAAAAGVMIGSFIRSGVLGETEEEAVGGGAIRVSTAAVVGAAVAALAVVFSPIAMAIAAKRACPSRSVHVARPDGGGGGGRRKEGHHLAGIDDSDIEEVEAGGEGPSAAAGNTVQIMGVVNQPRQQAQPPRQLLCAIVRPRLLAVALGPIVGDVSTNAMWGPAVTSSLLAALLFVGGLAGAAAAPSEPLSIDVPSAGCAAIPLALGAASALYAAAVAVLRPFLGIGHNASEALWAAAASIVFIVWGAAISSASGWASSPRAIGDADADALAEAFAPLPHLMAALCACRFPFAIARLLNVSLPAVATIQWGTNPPSPSPFPSSPPPPPPLTPSGGARGASSRVAEANADAPSLRPLGADGNNGTDGSPTTVTTTAITIDLGNEESDNEDGGNRNGSSVSPPTAGVSKRSRGETAEGDSAASRRSSRSKVPLPRLPRPSTAGDDDDDSLLPQFTGAYTAAPTRRAAAYAAAATGEDSSSSSSAATDDSDGVGGAAGRERRAPSSLSDTSVASSLADTSAAPNAGDGDTPSAPVHTDTDSSEERQSLLLGGSDDDDNRAEDSGGDEGFDDHLYL